MQGSRHECRAAPKQCCAFVYPHADTLVYQVCLALLALHCLPGTAYLAQLASHRCLALLARAAKDCTACLALLALSWLARLRLGGMPAIQ